MILIVSNSLTGGGAERSMNLLANLMNDNGIKAILVTANSSPSDYVSLKYKHYSLARKHNSKLYQLLKLVIKFNLLLFRLKPKQVIINCDLPELLMASALFKCKIIAVEHTDKPWANRRMLGNLVRRMLQIKNTKWVAVSRHLSIWPNAVIPHKIIRNLITAPSNHLPNSGNIIKRLIFIGRISPEKRPEWAVRIAKETELPITFIGAGEIFPALRDEIALANEIKIEFLGHKHNPWETIKSGDLLLIPSEYEGDGLVLLEAIALGVPVLVVNIASFKALALPDVHYCASTETFIEKITENKLHLETLVVEGYKKREILDSRDPAIILENWVQILGE